jgi:iron(III) transport system substrate-binding protein
MMRNSITSAICVLLLLCCFGCREQEEVIVYTSQDQVYSSKLFEDFTEESGIVVKAVYDSEAVKTVGIANRLIAEKSNPQADVFWSNEEMRTHQLDLEEVFDSAFGWQSFGYRTRRLVYNTNLVSRESLPRSLSELTTQQWKGKVALAYPLFGTTTAYFLALREKWGEPDWLKFCRALNANEPMVVDGNSVVVQLVGRGEAWVGLTDFDDIQAGIASGLPVATSELLTESYAIPNTVGLIRNARNKANALVFIDYLQRPDVIAGLIEAKALEGLDPSELLTTFLKPNWSAVLGSLDVSTEQLKSVFLK